MRIVLVCLLTLLVGCSSQPIEFVEPQAVALPPYLPVAWDLDTEAWQGTHEGVPFVSHICSYHSFYSEGIFVEQMYCHAEFLVSEEVLIPCPILMVRLDLGDAVMGTTPHPLADPICADLLPMFDTAPSPTPPTPVRRKSEPTRDPRATYAYQ